MSPLFNDQTVEQAAREDSRTILIEDGFINLTPSDEGFAAIAARFADQIITDVRKARQSDDRVLLAEVIKIVALLSRNGQNGLLRDLIQRIER